MEIIPADRRLLLDYARAVIRSSLAREALPSPQQAAIFARRDGCFVTLHSLDKHRLRGCIGRLTAEGPLGETIREMSDAVLHDSRFEDMPVTLAELSDLEIELTLLSPLEPASHALDFDLLEHGIYLQYFGRSGCFLPQVARETGWDRPTLLARLCTEKMGLPPEAWRDPDARLLRFTTTIVGPEPFEDG